MRVLAVLAALVAATLITAPVAARPDNGGAHGPRTGQHGPRQSDHPGRRGGDKGSVQVQVQTSEADTTSTNDNATNDNATNDNVVGGGKVIFEGPGNSGAAHACQEDQQGFRNIGQCVSSYAHAMHEEQSQENSNENTNQNENTNDNTSTP